MGQRQHTKARCACCGLHFELCACHLSPKLVTRTPITFFQSYKESLRPTSTGTLAHYALKNSMRYIYGKPRQCFDQDIAATLAGSILIFPLAGAKVLSKEMVDSVKPPSIVVLDGTWSEARRLLRRLELLKYVTVATLLDAPKTAWGIRRETVDGGLATCEAVAHMLNIIGENEPSVALSRYFLEVTTRMKVMRGSLHPSVLAKNQSTSAQN